VAAENLRRGASLNPNGSRLVNGVSDGPEDLFALCRVLAEKSLKLTEAKTQFPHKSDDFKVGWRGFPLLGAEFVPDRRGELGVALQSVLYHVGGVNAEHRGHLWQHKSGDGAIAGHPFIELVGINPEEARAELVVELRKLYDIS
jgi:hypothetical protein